MQAWLSSSLVRHYPGSPARQRRSLRLDAARGETIAFQAALRSADEDLRVAAQAAAPDGVEVQVRRVRYVPVPHLNTQTPPGELEGAKYLPGLAPDPLYPDADMHLGPHETGAFWISVRVPLDARPGRYAVRVALTPEGGEARELAATLVVHEAVLPSRRDFPVTHWFYADALCDWYKVELADEAFWPILDAYLADLSGHGQDTVYVPVLTPPLDGVKRPTQLLNVRRRGDRYSFDWSLVRRWVKAARAKGLTRFEWTHLFTQWGAEYAIRVYRGRGESGLLMWPPETPAASPTYRAFLAQFLPELEGFLRSEALAEASFFHVSDEPHGEQHRANYRAARGMLRELAPWMTVMDALSEIEFAREGLIDVPIPSITVAPDFVREGFPAWAYFCSGPRGEYLNRLIDTPLTKIRMSGWLFYKTQVRGFLHWGYNYWYQCGTTHLIDPYLVSDALNWPGWAYGDPFVVYPGPVGPVDSLRWEVFAESLQDYALLQAAGVDPAGSMLAEIRDFAVFPRDEAWIAAKRRDLLLRLDEG